MCSDQGKGEVAVMVRDNNGVYALAGIWLHMHWCVYTGGTREGMGIRVGLCSTEHVCEAACACLRIS